MKSKSLLIIIIFILIFLGLSLGNTWINLFNLDDREIKIIYYLRSPRIIFGLLCGMGLAISGTVIQGVTRNPMASPFTLGISSAAAFGAAVSIVFLSDNSIFTLVGAFSATLVCAFFIYLASLKKGMKSLTIIILGIAMNYLFSALTSTLHYIASEEKISSIVKWSFGSLNDINWDNVILLLIFLVPSIIFFNRKAWILNLLSNSSDDYAMTLGINPTKERLYLSLVSLILTSIIISTCGIIGFIGLTSPYISKKIVGENHKLLLTHSMLIGGLLLLISDILGRVLVSPLIIPVGIILSYIGVPILIHLIFKREEL